MKKRSCEKFRAVARNSAEKKKSWVSASHKGFGESYEKLCLTYEKFRCSYEKLCSPECVLLWMAKYDILFFWYPDGLDDNLMCLRQTKIGFERLKWCFEGILPKRPLKRLKIEIYEMYSYFWNQYVKIDWKPKG